MRVYQVKKLILDMFMAFGRLVLILKWESTLEETKILFCSNYDMNSSNLE